MWIYLLFISSCSHIFASTDVLTNNGTLTHTHACYQSLSEPKVFFILDIHFPTAPRYILADIEYHLVPKNPAFSLKDDWITHHLVLIDGKCSSTFQFYTGGISIKLLKIRLSMYLGYRHSQFLDFRYDFDHTFKFDMENMEDVLDRAKLFASVVSQKNPFNHVNVPVETIKTSLKYIEAENKYICVTVDDKTFIIKPKYSNNKIPSGHIAAITARIYQGEKSDSFVTWSAYGCLVQKYSFRRDLNFIVSKFDNNTKLYFTLRYVEDQSARHNINMKDLEKEIRFTTADIVIRSFDDSQKLPKTAKKIYMMDLNKGFEMCLDDTEQYIYMTKSKLRLYGYKYNVANVATGTKRYIEVHKADSKKC